MAKRAGIVLGQPGSRPGGPAEAPAGPLESSELPRQRPPGQPLPGAQRPRSSGATASTGPLTICAPPLRWPPIFLAIAATSILLALIPGRPLIPPLVESDYCYLLLAADRMYDGHGLTSLPPVAPHQPWSWEADWAFLTKWPIGYALLIGAFRWVFQLPTIQACQWISAVACAISLVGWFTWVKRIVPQGDTGTLLAIVAAASSVSPALLLDPSTDLLLVAALPYVLLLVTEAVRPSNAEPENGSERRTVFSLAAAGLLAGGLFWIRYAAVFVPIAIGAHLLIEWFLRRTIHLRHVTVFAACTAIPIVAILALNAVLGMEHSTQERLNLGHSIGFDFSPALIARAWWKLTDLGFYDYHAFTHWLYALWPIALCVIAMGVPSVRRRMRSSLATPPIALSGLTVLCLLAMLIAAGTLFANKFDYVDLDRYYLPVRPLYFVLFAAPVLLIPRRVVRAIACIALLVACSWIVQEDWHRHYSRRLAADKPMTLYGRQAACFEPNAADLYHWLERQQSPNLIVVSNFHEFIALETKIPTLPIPPDPPTLDDWIGRISASRSLTDPRVLFVLDPDNKWRDYWIPPPAEIVRTFKLEPHPSAPRKHSARVFDYRA